ncbi:MULTISPECIES: glycosyltransferase [Paenibacillus]|uniref:glycosyltransferase n=1 Tax=Paenibacillus TaxID=44249 RepID=UPI002FE08E9D
MKKTGTRIEKPIRSLALLNAGPSTPLREGAGEMFPRENAALAAPPVKSPPHSPSRTGELYDIFRFPVIDWHFRWQRPQQISRQFADRGHRVFYVTTEMNPLPMDAGGKEDIARYVKIKKIAPRVWNVTLCSSSRLNLYQDQMSPRDVEFLSLSVEVVKEKFAITEMVSIVDLPFWSPLVENLTEHTIVYDCMDDHAGFSTNASSMLHQEERMILRADLVLASSQGLQEKLQRLRPDVSLLRNAADVSHFARSAQVPTAAELEKLRGPVIGYYGAISDWFDIDLIRELAEKRKDWTFVLIGHTFGCDISKVEHLKNVLLLGEKPYQQLPGYLRRFDVALIPFRQNRLTEATNPVKLYEYLAAGKPVVSTELPEVASVSPHLVGMASDPVSFEQAIESALRSKAPELEEKRREFARQHSWEQRYLDIHELILKRLYPKVSVIVVTHNNWTYTQQCLRSLLRPGHYPNLEIVIVDNASTDQTSLRLRRIRDSRIKIILSERNLGFAAGNSQGIEQATGEYYILLNNDTIVPDGSWISRLLRPMQENPSVGMTGPMSNFVGNDQALDHFVADPVSGAHPDWLQDFYRFNQGRVRTTELLGFFCVAMKKEVWEKIGPLDTGYGIGMFEDDDYCERVRAAGYRLLVVEDAFVYHHGSATIRKMQPEVYKELWEKNKGYFEQKWGKSWRTPLRPDNLFSITETPRQAAERIQEAGVPCILILGEKKWTAYASRWQYVVRELASSQNFLLIINALRHYNRPITGFRKGGYLLYLTNRVDLLAEAELDAVIYCGESAPVPVNAKRRIADSFAYPEDQLGQLSAALPDLERWTFRDPAEFARRLKEEVLGSCPLLQSST